MCEVRRTHKVLTMVVACLGAFMIQLDGSIVTLALPRIQADLHTSLSDLQVFRRDDFQFPQQRCIRRLTRRSLTRFMGCCVGNRIPAPLAAARATPPPHYAPCHYISGLASPPSRVFTGGHPPPDAFTPHIKVRPIPALSYRRHQRRCICHRVIMPLYSLHLNDRGR